MPANRRLPRVVGSLKRSKAPSSRKLTCAAWTVARKRTSISRMRSSNAGSLSSILPQRNSLALWTVTSMRRTRLPLSYWDYPLREDLTTPGWRNPGNAKPEVNEYLRRQAMSERDYKEFRVRLDHDFP